MARCTAYPIPDWTSLTTHGLEHATEGKRFSLPIHCCDVTKPPYLFSGELCTSPSTLNACLCTPSAVGAAVSASLCSEHVNHTSYWHSSDGSGRSYVIEQWLCATLAHPWTRMFLWEHQKLIIRTTPWHLLQNAPVFASALCRLPQWGWRSFWTFSTACELVEIMFCFVSDRIN